MKKSQEQLILEYLRTGKSITPLDALRLFGCMRLSGRIFDLKKKGHRIEEMDTEVNGKRFARYFLASELEETVANHNLTMETVINMKAVNKQIEFAR